MCTITQTHLPCYFLQDFELIQHPRTQEPWWLPRSLPSVAGSRNDPRPKETRASQTSTLGTNLGQRGYTLKREAMLAAMVKPNDKLTQAHTRLAPIKNRQSGSGKIKIRDVIWRQDMHSFIAGVMRDGVKQEILAQSLKRSAYFEKWLRDGKGMSNMRGAGIMLWVGDERGWREECQGSGQIEYVFQRIEGEPERQENTQQLGADSKGDAMRYIARLRRQRRVVPVYNLAMLIGAERMDVIRKSWDEGGLFVGAGMLVVWDRVQTMVLQERLWQLHGYLT